jgi:hypothetical protein
MLSKPGFKNFVAEFLVEQEIYFLINPRFKNEWIQPLMNLEKRRPSYSGY